MSRTIPITVFSNSNTEVRNDKRGVEFSVRVRRLDVHVDNGTDIEVKHVVKGNKMFIKVMADYTVVFEITANKDMILNIFLNTYPFRGSGLGSCLITES